MCARVIDDKGMASGALEDMEHDVFALAACRVGEG